MLDRASIMQYALSVNVRLASKLLGRKRPKENYLAVNCDICLPFPVVLANTKDASHVVSPRLSLVLSVPNPRDVPQIGDSVIRGVPVDMVNLLQRPLSSNVKPSESMGEVYLPVNRCLNTVCLVCVPNNVSNLSGLACNNSASKNSGFCIVENNSSKPIGIQRIVNYLWYWSARIKEVVNPVVAWNLVFSAKVFQGDVAMNIKPRKFGRLMGSVIEIDGDAATSTAVSRNTTGHCYPATAEPSKNASIGVVVKKLFKSSLREFRIVGSHAVVPFKQWFGEKPRCVTSTSGLRYFKGLHYCNQAVVSGVSI